MPRTVCNFVDVKQVVRSSGSVAANYIEANESLGGKDFVYRARVARKEAKETRLWLRLVDTHAQPTLEEDRDRLIQEAVELTRILSAIINTRT